MSKVYDGVEEKRGTMTYAVAAAAAASRAERHQATALACARVVLHDHCHLFDVRGVRDLDHDHLVASAVDARAAYGAKDELPRLVANASLAQVSDHLTIDVGSCVESEQTNERQEIGVSVVIA